MPQWFVLWACCPLSMLWHCHMYCLFLPYLLCLLLLRTFSVFMFFFSILKALYYSSFFFIHLLPPYFYPTPHHSTHQYLNLIMGSCFPLLFHFLICVVLGQVPKLLVTETQLSFLLFKFFSQFSERAFLFEHTAHQVVVLLLRHCSDIS